MASTTKTKSSKTKKSKQAPSIPCEVFFACTLCGHRSRTVPQLHTHYKSSHKGEINGKAKTKSGEDGTSLKDGDGAIKCNKSPPEDSSSGEKPLSKTRRSEENKGNSSPSSASLAGGSAEGSSDSAAAAGGSSDSAAAAEKEAGKSSAGTSSESGSAAAAEKEVGKSSAGTSSESGSAPAAEKEAGKSSAGTSSESGKSLESSKSATTEGAAALQSSSQAEHAASTQGEKMPLQSTPGTSSKKETSSSPTASQTSPTTSSSSAFPNTSTSQGESMEKVHGAKPLKADSRGKKRKLSGDSTDGHDCDGKKHSSKKGSKSENGHKNKDTVITRKKNVPLGMLKGKKNSLMVIFQHADQTKPLPEGSSFKLRNSGGEQTYLVVANVDVDIIESTHRKPSAKSK